MGLSFFTFFILLLSFYAQFGSVNPQPFDHVSIAPSPAPQPANTPKIQSSTLTVCDVRSFGSVGDGVTDDTQGFKMAWDSACQNDDPTVLLVPKHYTFLIQSTIFTGSCRNSLVFQVRYNGKIESLFLFLLIMVYG